MNNLNIKLHHFQKAILKKLTMNTSLRFNELLIKDLESEHTNYHLKKLLEFGFVKKESNRYMLTDTGKDYSNLLDDKIDIIEKQPKTSVIMRCVRKNTKGEVEHLLNKRLRHPYFGKVGRPSGKVRFGETFEQAAARELYEETGLRAKTFDLEEIYRKIRKRKDDTTVQDVIFYIILMKDFSGTFIPKTPYQENFWITQKELEQRDDLDVYKDLVLSDRLKPRKPEIVESVSEAKDF
jgi:ADP-ribose pyrophosphatase YjhB (NUDIX family)